MSQSNKCMLLFVDVIHFEERLHKGRLKTGKTGIYKINTQESSRSLLTVCNFIVHEKCVTNVVTPCSGVAPCLIKNPVAHCWSEPIHHKRRFCNVCRKRLDETAAVHCMSEFELSCFSGFYNLVFFKSLRVLCAHRVSGLCDCRLQGERHVRSGERTGIR